MTTKFDFKPASEKPTQEGEYILLNKCSGYLLANAHFDNMGFIGFYAHFGTYVVAYDYWAKIEECSDAVESAGEIKKYSFSRDYNLLFDLLINGFVALGYVDYKFVGDDLVFRDACQIKRLKDWDINIGVRGTSYASIYDFDHDHWKGDERSLFVRTCEMLNLDWIQP